jgi:hypothetical protein
MTHDAIGTMLRPGEHQHALERPGREFQGERVGAAALQGVRFRPADALRPSPPDATLFRSILDDHVRAGDPLRIFLINVGHRPHLRQRPQFHSVTESG